MKLRFFAVEGLDSYSPPRVRLNKIEPIGKVRNADGAWVPDVQPATVVLGGDELQGDWQYLRKDVSRGHVLVADEETAKLLEVPWDATTVATRVEAAKAAEERARVIEEAAAQLIDEQGKPVDVPATSLADATAALLALPPSDPAAVLTPRADGDPTPLADALGKAAETIPPPPPEAPAVTPAKAPSRRKET